MKQGDTVQITNMDHPHPGEEGTIQGIKNQWVLIRLCSGEYTTCPKHDLKVIQNDDITQINMGDYVRIKLPEWEGAEGVVELVYEGLYEDRVVIALTDNQRGDLAMEDVELVDVSLPKNTLISGDGNNSLYYIVHVDNPTDESWEPYYAQCNDLIEALGMTFSEGEAFKAIWRRCRARQGFGKPDNSQKYDAEKVKFFGHRMVVQS